MANFQEIYESEQFQALDPGKQTSVRDRFFQTQVEPAAQAEGFDIPRIKTKFNKSFDISQNIAKRIKGAGGQALASVRQKLDSIVNDVDRDTGINHLPFRGDLSEMTGIKEKANFLNDIIGANNWGVGNQGQDDFVIKTKEGLDRLELGHLWKGKPIAIDERGITKSDIFGDTRGAAPAVIGGIIGGAATGGLGFLPAMAMSGLTAAGFKGFDEARQSLADGGKYQLQGSKEIAGDLATEFGLAATGEGIGRALRPAGRFLFGANRGRPFTATGRQPAAKSTVAAETRHTAKLAADKDVLLPITKATGKNKLLGFFQRMTDTILGDPRAAQNAKAIAKWSKDITGHDLGSNVAKQTFGEGIVRKVGGQALALKKATAQASSSARRGLQEAKNMLRGGAKIHIEDDVGMKVRDTVIAAHDDFMEASSVKYAEGLSYAGVNVDAKVFSTKPLQRIASSRLKKMLETKTGEKVSVATTEVQGKLQKFADLEDTASFSQLTELRKELGRSAYTGNLHSDVASHDATQFLKKIDTILDDFVNVPQPRDAGTGRMLSRDWKQTIGGFREANDAYRKGIAPFKDILTKSITKDLAERGAVEPSLLVNVLRNESSERIGNLMGIVGRKNPKLASQVKARFFDDVIWGDTVAGGEIGSHELLKNITRLKPGVLKKVYGEQANTITKLAHDLDKFGHGKLATDAIEEGGVVGKLGRMVNAAKQEEQFLKQNFNKIAELGPNTGGSEYGKLINLAMKDAGAAKELLSRSTSEEIKKAQGIMTRELFNTMVKTGDDGIDVLSPGALQKALEKIGALRGKGADNALKIFLGPDKFQEIVQLARVANSTLTKGNSGLVAMSIALRPLSHLGTLAEVHLISRLLSRPGVIKWFVKGAKGKAWRKGGDATVRAATQFLSSQVAIIMNDADFQKEMELLQGQQ